MSGQLRRHEVIPGLVLVAGGMILVAVWAFGRGAEDWRYEIAGLGDHRVDARYLALRL
jgi:hypothetical protein